MTTKSETGNLPKVAPVLRVRLEGDNVDLGTVPASDVANLLLLVERAIARAASVEVGRPSRKVGRRERVVAEASHLVLLGIESGSVVPVLELPIVRPDADDPQQAMETADEQLAETAVGRVLDALSGESDAHPYVVEVLALMAEQLGIGDRYSGVSFEFAGSSVNRRQAALDSTVASRMQEQVERYRTATTKGLLVGTLVEADFEAFTARLRNSDGAAVAVKFEEAMSSEIKEALTETGALQGWITYDPVSHTAQSIDLQAVVKSPQTTLNFDGNAFERHHSFSELQEDQGIVGVVDVNDLADTESSESDLDAYESALQRLTDA